MSVEDRLSRAMRSFDRVEPSADLWSRIVHSIEEDIAHRRRVRNTGIGVVASALLLVGAAAMALSDGPAGTHVAPAVAELLETIALAGLVGALGPSIRRFGRGYASDLWPSSPTTADAVVRLLDVAYVLVFAGYVLLTTSITWEPVPDDARLCDLSSFDCHHLGGQLADAGARFGGLLLLMGVLHAVTIAVLPFVALVDNATRRGRPLPRWLTILLIGLAALIGFQLLSALAGALLGMAGS